MDRGVVDTAKGALQSTKNIFNNLMNWDPPSVSLGRSSAKQQDASPAVSDQTWKRIQRETLQTPTERPGLASNERSQSSLYQSAPQSSILQRQLDGSGGTASRYEGNGLSMHQVTPSVSSALPTNASHVQAQTESAIRNAYSTNTAPLQFQSAAVANAQSAIPVQQSTAYHHSVEPAMSMPGQWQSSAPIQSAAPATAAAGVSSSLSSWQSQAASGVQNAAPEISNMAGPSTRTLRFATDSAAPIDPASIAGPYHHEVNYSAPSTSANLGSGVLGASNGVGSLNPSAYNNNAAAAGHLDVGNSADGQSSATSSGVLVNGRPLAAFGSDYRYAVPHPKNSVSGQIRASAVDGRRASITNKIKGELADAARNLYGNAAASHAGLGSLSRRKTREF